MNGDINLIGLIVGCILFLLTFVIYEFIHLWVAKHLGYNGKFKWEKIKYLGYCPGVKLSNLHNNVICANNLVPILLAPLFPSIVLMSVSLVVTSESLSYAEWYDIIAGVFFGVLLCSMDIYAYFWLKK